MLKLIEALIKSISKFKIPIKINNYMLTLTNTQLREFIKQKVSDNSGFDIAEINPGTTMDDDLGLDSLDICDMQFQIEGHFNNEFCLDTGMDPLFDKINSGEHLTYDEFESLVIKHVMENNGTSYQIVND